MNEPSGAGSRSEVLIVGAGVCGLTLAYQLGKQGRRVTVLEREPVVGGLARSFRYPEGSFDVGPHRFHTHNQRIRDLILEVLGDDALTIPRLSMVHFRGHYYRWPIHPSVHLLRFPLPIMLGIAFDLVFRLYRRHPPRTFSEYVLNMYGKTLYREFFRDYSEKFLGITPEETDADWAKTGIDRAIIDERLKINTLWELLRSIFVRPSEVETKFVYARGGTGGYCDKLRVLIERQGGRVLTGRAVTGVEADDGRIRAMTCGDERHEADRFVWTAPITLLADRLGVDLADAPGPPLRYLDIVFFNVVTKSRGGPDFQWCYFGEKGISFNRVSRPEDFDPGIFAQGHGLCVEVSAPKGRDVWQNPDELLPRIMSDLIRVGLLRSQSDVEAVHIERVPECYPIYEAGYRARLKWMRERLGRFANLTTAGRTGMYWYNNMDHSIGLAMKLARDDLASVPPGEDPQTV